MRTQLEQNKKNAIAFYDLTSFDLMTMGRWLSIGMGCKLSQKRQPTIIRFLGLSCRQNRDRVFLDRLRIVLCLGLG